MKKRKVTLIKGGVGSEREVSLLTGSAVANGLREAGCEVEELVLTENALPFHGKPDVVFLALHGAFGEDGGIQKLLEDKGIFFTGEGSVVSELAFDKLLSKERFALKGVPTPPWQVLKEKGEALEINLPLVFKPAREGSSVGVEFVREEKSLEGCLERLFSCSGSIFAEKLIEGREFTVGFLGEQILPIVEIKPKNGFYDYKNKYTAGATEYFCPANIPSHWVKKIEEVARASIRALGCKVYGRVDILVDGQGEAWVIEINTIPGMTATSLLPKSAQEVGISFSQLCEIILETSLKRFGKVEGNE